MKHTKVAQLVQATYEKSDDWFTQWMWENHVPIVAQKTDELAKKYGAHADLAVAGAWLHDFGDAFVHRHSAEHDEISEKEAFKVLEQAEYSKEDIAFVMNEVIAPHSCRDGFVPTTIEGKVMTTADSLAHLTTNFYIEFAWMHIPENIEFKEFLQWVAEKLERDFHTKIFFDDVRDEVKYRYEALKEVFVNFKPS